MRPFVIAILSASLVLVACTSVLGIDGTFESVSQAFCTDIATRCSTTITGFDETKCEQSFPPGTLSHDDYVGCTDAGDCATFVACLDKANAGNCKDLSAVGRPCTTAADCCTKTCSVDGGPGVCQ